MFTTINLQLIKTNSLTSQILQLNLYFGLCWSCLFITPLRVICDIHVLKPTRTRGQTGKPGGPMYNSVRVLEKNRKIKIRKSATG